MKKLREVLSGLITRFPFLKHIANHSLAKRLQGLPTMALCGLGLLPLLILLILIPCCLSSSDDDFAAILAKERDSERREALACDLFKKELARLDPLRQLYGIRLVSETPEIVAKDAESISLRYICEIYPLENAYFKDFLPRMRKLLEQIASEKPTPFVANVKREENSEYKYYYTYAENASKTSQNPLVRLPVKTKLSLLVGPDKQESKESLRYASRREDQKAPLFVLSLITEMNKSMTVINGQDYPLAQSFAKAYQDWELEYMGDHYPKKVSYLLQLLDKRKNVVAQQDFSIPTTDILVPSCCSVYSRGPRVEWVPLCGDNSSEYAKTRQFFVRIKVAKEDADRIKSSRVGLVENML